jgi:hypothetical protein
MITRFHTALSVIALVVVSSTQAQFVQDPNDQGEADTVRMVCTLRPDADTHQLDVTMDLYFFNDVQNLSSAAVGFRWINDNLVMTEAIPSPVSQAVFNFILYVYRSDDIDSTNLYDQFQFTAARRSGGGLVAGPTAKLVASYNFTLSDWDVLDSLVVDTQRVLGARFVFGDLNNVEYRPYWAGKIVVYDANRPILSNLVFSQDTLRFEATKGLGNPPPQTVQIMSDRDPIAFSLVEDVSWLLKSPASGTTPQDVSVSVTTVGLAVGSYFDSIRVESPEAVNSPQFLYVDLILNPPPPVIKASPTSFLFNALVGGDDPQSQVLRITNIGGSSLNWEATSKSLWLAIDPSSGSDGDSTVVSVSVSGLGYGDYYDTISVSDPQASNSPVLVPVRLSVASDLPRIEVHDTLIQVVIYPGGPPTNPVTFEVLNSGGGVLDFTVGKSCTQSDMMRQQYLAPLYSIDSIVPGSGTAPATVSVYFNLSKVPYGAFLIDTLCVHSASAVNSPVRVIIQQRLVLEPAMISVPAEPVVMTVYECDQGYGQGMPVTSFEVQNSGGDNPMPVILDYESEFFEVTNPLPLGNAPQTIALRALPVELPLGLYYDTIVVTSPWAANKPQLVVVLYDLRSGDETPEILVQPTQIVIPYQADSGPMIYDNFHIFNVHGGCMPWAITGTPEWLTPSTSEGDVPGTVPMLVEASGYDMGEHAGVVTVSASSASNNPLSIDCVLKVWKLRGDVNWNGRISVQDVACMIDYVFEEEHAPQPAVGVGDVNCDSLVDVADIVLTIQYLFETLEPLCGNPY